MLAVLKVLKTFKKSIKNMLTNILINDIIILVRQKNTNYVVIIAKRIHLFPFRTQKLSSLALMVLGGRPPGRVRRSHVYGPLVKRSRHRPFTAVTGVRFPYGAPFPGTIAQLGEHLPYKQGVTGSSPVSPTICGLVVQLVRMPACHAGGRGFESLPGRQLN